MSRWFRLWMFTLIALLLAACGATTSVATTTPTAPSAAVAAPTAGSAATISVTDVAGRTVTLPKAAERIISLAPSTTEILFALDLEAQIVGVDELSDYPPAALKLPKVGGSNGNYNYEQLVALKPDLVIASGLSGPEVVKKLEELQLTAVVINTAKTSFASIVHDITLVGQLAGRSEQAQKLTQRMQAKLDALKSKLQTASTKPRVYWEIDATDQAKPYTVGPGNFIDELITFAGGTNIFATASSQYPQVGLEQVVAAAPEVIILADTAYGVPPESIAQRPGWSDLPAVQQQRVYPIDPDLVSRPGPRIVEGMEATAKLIHPEVFP